MAWYLVSQRSTAGDRKNLGIKTTEITDFLLRRSWLNRQNNHVEAGCCLLSFCLLAKAVHWVNTQQLLTTDIFTWVRSISLVVNTSQQGGWFSHVLLCPSHVVEGLLRIHENTKAGSSFFVSFKRVTMNTIWKNVERVFCWLHPPA